METRLAGQEVDVRGRPATTRRPTRRSHYLAADRDAEPLQHARGEAGRAARSRGPRAARSTSLDARSRRIIEARWLREKDAAHAARPRRRVQVSAERIRQIEAKALEKMRKALPAPA